MTIKPNPLLKLSFKNVSNSNATSLWLYYGTNHTIDIEIVKVPNFVHKNKYAYYFETIFQWSYCHSLRETLSKCFSQKDYINFLH